MERDSDPSRFPLICAVVASVYAASYGILRITGVFINDHTWGFAQVLPYYNASTLAFSGPITIGMYLTSWLFHFFYPLILTENWIRNLSS